MSNEHVATDPLVMQLTPEVENTIAEIQGHLRAAIDSALALTNHESRLQALTYLGRDIEHAPVVYRSATGEEHRVPSTAQRLQQAKADAMLAALDDGMTQYAIARVAGMTRPAVQQALRRARSEDVN